MAKSRMAGQALAGGLAEDYLAGADSGAFEVGSDLKAKLGNKVSGDQASIVVNYDTGQTTMTNDGISKLNVIDGGHVTTRSSVPFTIDLAEPVYGGSGASKRFSNSELENDPDKTWSGTMLFAKRESAAEKAKPRKDADALMEHHMSLFNRPKRLLGGPHDPGPGYRRPSSSAPSPSYGGNPFASGNSAPVSSAPRRSSANADSPF